MNAADPVTFTITISPPLPDLDPLFRLDHYEALVYNAWQYNHPDSMIQFGSLEPTSNVLDLDEALTMNILISRVGLRNGQNDCVLPYDPNEDDPFPFVPRLVQATRRVIETAIGRGLRWRGRVEHTDDGRDVPRRRNDGWVTVTFMERDVMSPNGFLRASDTEVARASRGGHMEIFFDGSGTCTLPERTRSQLEALYAHELGHVLGFKHVSDDGWIMYYAMDRTDFSPGVRPLGYFSGLEAHQMMRAYQNGPGYPRCREADDRLCAEHYLRRRP